MAKAYVKSPEEASVNAYAIQLGGRTILVDALAVTTVWKGDR